MPNRHQLRAPLLVALAVVLAACQGAGAPPAATGTIGTAATPSPAGGATPSTRVSPPPGPVRAVVRARVIRVVDGDTIIVSVGGRQERLRYIGLDAPESRATDIPEEPFGREASAANRALVGDREVLLERDVSDRDRFGRLLRYVWLESAGGLRFVNFELVVLGYAGAVTLPPDVRHAVLLLAAEREARAMRRGLWSGAGSPAATRHP